MYITTQGGGRGYIKAVTLESSESVVLVWADLPLCCAASDFGGLCYS